MKYVTAALLLISPFLWSQIPSGRPAKQFLNRDGSNPPGYTHVVTSRADRLVFISGQGGTGRDGKLPADFEAQAKNTFENLARCLSLAGATFQDIVKINYYVTDLTKTSELRKIRANYLNMAAPPASTLVQAGLGSGLLLEIEAIAVVPE